MEYQYYLGAYLKINKTSYSDIEYSIWKESPTTGERFDEHFDFDPKTGEKLIKKRKRTQVEEQYRGFEDILNEIPTVELDNLGIDCDTLILVNDGECVSLIANRVDLEYSSHDLIEKINCITEDLIKDSINEFRNEYLNEIELLKRHFECADLQFGLVIYFM